MKEEKPDHENPQLIFTGIGIILVGIGLILIIPFIVLWAINGLFSLHIQYTWMNWLYIVIIMGALKAHVSSK
jgi:hypothetical protein